MGERLIEEPTAAEEDYIDLATRFEGSINVALFWDRVKGDLVVVAQDRLTGEDVRIPVEPERAAEVYRHRSRTRPKGCRCG
jgi:hypothetical protein